MEKISAHPLLLTIALILLFVQGVFIFNDARKIGEKFYWLWGLFGLLNVPCSLIIYLLVTRVFKKNNA